uniref:Small ribosomal subunit protein uS8 n=1 Tax=candidate division CPR3 bacterium TaxID=2268181 RepID=A0A7C5YXY2_UNCC3
MSTDPIADMIAMLNNANEKYFEKVDVPSSKIKEEIAKILKEEGYILSYKKIEDYKQGILRIYLKYGPNKERVFTKIKRVSKPGLRIYRKYYELPKVNRGLDIAIVSTSKGILTDKEARKRHLGGEVLCIVT